MNIFTGNRKNPSKLTKNLVEKFFSNLRKSSPFKKIPNIILKNIYSLIDDKSTFLNPENLDKNNVKNHFLSLYLILTKFLVKFMGRLEGKFIIHPYENYKICWDFIHFLLMICLFFYLPLDIIFELQSSKTMRIMLSCLMIFDNLLGFSTAYFYHGKLITERKQIFKLYIYQFLFDLITQICLTYDLILLNDEETELNRKFVRLICLVQYRKFKKIYQTLIDRFKIDIKIGCLLDFINLIATSFCVMHWVACGWVFIGEIPKESESWIHNVHNIVIYSKIDKYIYAFYWSAVTMMTVGYGDITPYNIYETIYATLIVVLGCGLFAYYIKYIDFINIYRNIIFLAQLVFYYKK